MENTDDLRKYFDSKQYITTIIGGNPQDVTVPVTSEYKITSLISLLTDPSNKDVKEETLLTLKKEKGGDHVYHDNHRNKKQHLSGFALAKPLFYSWVDTVHSLFPPLKYELTGKQKDCRNAQEVYNIARINYPTTHALVVIIDSKPHNGRFNPFKCLNGSDKLKPHVEGKGEQHRKNKGDDLVGGEGGCKYANGNIGRC